MVSNHLRINLWESLLESKLLFFPAYFVFILSFLYSTPLNVFGLYMKAFACNEGLAIIGYNAALACVGIFCVTFICLQ
jgi:hypothetical protein